MGFLSRQWMRLMIISFDHQNGQIWDHPEVHLSLVAVTSGQDLVRVFPTIAFISPSHYLHSKCEFLKCFKIPEEIISFHLPCNFQISHFVEFEI